MKNLKPVVSSIAVLCLFASLACSSGTDTSSPASIDEAVDRAVAARPDESDSGQNACLLGYQTKYDELLPLARAATAAGLPADQAEVEYQKVMSNAKYHELSYSWPSDRFRTVSAGGMSIKAPRPNRVALTGIGSTSLRTFRLSYRPVTDDDKKKLDEAIDTSKEQGLETAAQKDMAKQITGIIGEITRAYRDVDGVGDAASFNTAESKLYVLDRGVEFGVVADVSADPDANQKVAIDIATQILAACR